MGSRWDFAGRKNSSTEYLSPQRKRNCLIFRWLVFAFFALCLVLESLAVVVYKTHPHASKIMYIFGFAMISIMIGVITVLISLSLHMFIKIVRLTGKSQELNIAPVLLQILGLVVWTGGWIATGVIFLHFYTNLDQYEPLQKTIIIDIVSFVANLFVFIVVAYVLYKSSQVVQPKHDPILKKDVSLLAYMRNQYASEQKESFLLDEDRKGLVDDEIHFDERGAEVN